MESVKIHKRQVVQTLVYADLFDYPMKKEEVIKWLITTDANSPNRNHLEKNLEKINGVVFRKNNLLFLKERNHLVDLRKDRQKQALLKLEIAKRTARLLSLIPTIKLIGVSGSLSMNNANDNDDIDFFIITSRSSLWLTRLISIIILELTGRRRRPKDENTKDKICLNMFMDDANLTIPKDYQSLYTAHEVCQLRVLFDRDEIHQRFLRANVWVKGYLPNATPREKGLGGRGKPLSPMPYALYPIELCAKLLQLFYMKLRNRRVEKTNGALRFYPSSYHQKILAQYEKRLKNYGFSV